MSIDINNIADGYDIGNQLLEAYQAADDKEKFLDELDSLKGSGALSNYNRDTFRYYANKGITPNGNISVVSNVGSTKDLTELYEKPITTRQDKLHEMVQKEFDDTQVLVENEFNETQELVQKEFDETQQLVTDEFTKTRTLIKEESDETQTLIKTESDETQNILQTEFDETQGLIKKNHKEIVDTINNGVTTVTNKMDTDTNTITDKLDSNTNTINTTLGSNHTEAMAKWDKIISILTVLGTSPLTEEDMAEVLAAS